MKMTSIQQLLESVVLGKVIAVQDSIHENYHKSQIIGIMPCDLNYGSDNGFLILTDSTKAPCRSFTVDANTMIVFE